MSKKIFVFESFESLTPTFMGTIYIEPGRNSELFSFEFSDKWLSATNYRFLLDPELMQFRGRQYSSKELFGIFADSCPDRWGRTLMERKERVMADKENRKPKKLYDSDYLIGVYDKTRMGALQYKNEMDGPFLADDKDTATPPWTTLRTLEEASRNYEDDHEFKNDKWINQLIKPGSSLGGARPKANVVDTGDNLWIAKFPSKHDDYNVGAWEKVATELADMCGILVPETRLETFSDYGSTFITKRFDRKKDKRIHFSSAMTLLGKTDGDDNCSYLDILSFIRANSANPSKDSKELWKRQIFNILINNTDDHLRNHGFILSENGWVLSPAYDLNPVPYGNELSLKIDETDNTASVQNAVSVCRYYGISEKEAKLTADEMKSIIRTNWERLASEYRISRKSIEYMRPAFEAK